MAAEMVTRPHNNRERVVLSLIYQLVPIRHPSRQKIKLQKYIYIRTKMSKDVNECIMSMNVAANLYTGLFMLSGPKRVAPTQTALDRFIRFAGRIGVPNAQIDSNTDHASPSVAISLSRLPESNQEA